MGSTPAGCAILIGKFFCRFVVRSRNMGSIIIPEGYTSRQNIMETEIAIKLIKDFFERELSKELNLTRISAPLFVKKTTGLNDNLNGVERPVAFEMKEAEG